MARSRKYWMDIMLAEKASFSNLNDLQPNVDNSQLFLNDLESNSKVEISRLIFWVVACCAHALDVVFDLAILIMTNLAAKSRYGTEPWYVDVAKSFQYGDALVQVNLEFVYPVIDEAKKIITLAACKEVIGGVNLKVAKTVANTPTKLDTAELNAFTAYAAKRKPAGININIISDDADELRLWLEVNYNPLVLKSNGESIAAPGTFPVEDAINNYLLNLEFDGKLELMKLVNAIEAIDPTLTAYVTQASARYGANPFDFFTQSYYPNAGHIKIETATPLNTTITYTANV